MTDKLPAAPLCPIAGCAALVAIGTVDTMCQKHWGMASSRVKWRVYDTVPSIDVRGERGGELLRRRRRAVIDEVHEKLRAGA